MPKITTLELVGVPDGSALITSSVAGGTSNLLKEVDGQVEVQYRLLEPATLTMRLMPGGGFARQAAAFTQDRILRATFADGSKEFFAITRVRETLGSSVPVVVEAWSYWTKLAGRRVRVSRTPGTFVDVTVSLVGLTAQQALNAVLSSAYNVPPYFVAGTVEGALASVKVNIEANGETHLDLLWALCADLATANGGTPAEPEFVWNGSAFVVNLYSESGWSAAERSAGVADGDLRPIEAATGGGHPTEANRIALTRTKGGREYFTRIVPLGGEEQEPVTIAQAEWLVTAATYSSGTGLTTITVDADIWPAGISLEAITALYFGVGPTFYAVSARVAANKFTVSGNRTSLLGERCRLTTSSAGADLVFIDSSATTTAEDVIEETIRFLDIAPYANLVSEIAGASADLSEWSGGLPVGWTAYNPDAATAPVISEETQAAYVKHGAKSAKVVCAAAGTGISCAIPLDLPDSSPYVSAFVNVYVGAGSIRLSIVDAAGVKHPASGEQAETNAKTLQALALAGVQPQEGTAYLVITALQAGTTFYVDAAALTNSAAEWPYSEKMGPRALFLAGLDYLKSFGGTQPDLYEGEAIDASAYDPGGAYEPLQVGAWVHVRDGWNGSSWDVDVEGRIETLTYRFDPDTGGLFRTVGLLRSYDTAADRLVGRTSRPKTTTAPKVSYTPAPADPGEDPGLIWNRDLIFEDSDPESPHEITWLSGGRLRGESGRVYVLTEAGAYGGELGVGALVGPTDRVYLADQFFELNHGFGNADTLNAGLVVNRAGSTKAELVWDASDTRWEAGLAGSRHPIALNSGLLQSNLNADLLDGYDASAFPRKAENAAVSGLWSFSQNPAIAGGTNWYSGNDGAGSGLDADLLDSYDASAFPRKAESATITSPWTFNAPPTVAAASALLYLQGSGESGIHFRRDGNNRWLWYRPNASDELLLYNYSMPGRVLAFEYADGAVTAYTPWTFEEDITLESGHRLGPTSDNFLGFGLGGGATVALASSANIYLALDSNNSSTTAAFILGKDAVYGGEANWTELLRVQEDGKVGIGQPSPSYLLDVNGTFRGVGAATLSSTLGVAGATTLSSTLGVSGAATLSGTLAVTGQADFATAVLTPRVGAYTAGSLLLDSRNQGSSGNYIEARLGGWGADYFQVTSGGSGSYEIFSVSPSNGGLFGGSGAVHTTYDGSGNWTYGKSVTIDPGTSSSYLYLNGGTSNSSGVHFRNGSSNRWLWYRNGADSDNLWLHGYGPNTGLLKFAYATGNATATKPWDFQDTVSLYRVASDLLPNAAYQYNIGAVDNKWLALFAAELQVETIVAHERRVTTGGRLTVGFSTVLEGDFTAANTSLFTKHNDLSVGDILHMEKEGQVEFMSVASGPTGTGPYIYTVTRNLDGTGANSWVKGDAIFNTKQAGAGFIDLTALYSLSDTTRSNVAGPALTVYSRTGSAYNAISERAVFGNLRGKYNYSTSVDTWGFAAGDPAAGNITVDPSGGVRFRAGSTTVGYINATDLSIANGRFAYNSSTDTATLSGWTATSTMLSSANIRFGTSNLSSSDPAGSLSIGHWNSGAPQIVRVKGPSSEVVQLVGGTSAAYFQAYNSAVTVNVMAGNLDAHLTGKYGFLLRQASNNLFYVTQDAAFAFGWTADTTKLYNASGGGIYLNAASTRITLGGDAAYSSMSAGIFLGLESSVPKFRLKDKLTFDGTNLAINGSGTFSGNVTATTLTATVSGQIGPWALSSTALSYSSGSVQAAMNMSTHGSIHVQYNDGTGDWLRAGMGQGYWNSSLRDFYGFSVGWQGTSANGGLPYFAAGMPTGSGGLTFHGDTAAQYTPFLHIGGTSAYMWFSGSTLKIAGELVAATGTFTGSLSAASGTFAGLVDAGGIKVGLNVNGSADGIYLDVYNYWYVNADLRVGNSSKYLLFDRSAGTLTFTGALSAATGTFAGSLSAATGTFAGSLSAATGTFAGSLSAATGTFAGSLSAASGTFAGLVDAGGAKFGLNVNGSLDGLYLDSNNYWYTTGTMRVGGASSYLSVSGGTATFTGALSGATGTFSGALSGATGTFAGSLSAASGTFTGTLSGASGSFSGTVTASTLTATSSGTIANFSFNGSRLSDGSTYVGSSLSAVSAAGRLLLGNFSGTTTPMLRIYGGSTSNYIQQFYVNSSDWGWQAVVGGVVKMHLGSSNYLGSLDVNGTLTVSGGSISFGSGAGTLSSAGLLLSTGTNDINSVRWSDGSRIHSSGGVLNLEANRVDGLFSPIRVLLGAPSESDVFFIWINGSGNAELRFRWANGSIDTIATM